MNGQERDHEDACGDGFSNPGGRKQWSGLSGLSVEEAAVSAEPQINGDGTGESLQGDTTSDFIHRVNALGLETKGTQLSSHSRHQCARAGRESGHRNPEREGKACG